MNDHLSRVIASAGLVVGALLGMAGAFVAAVPLRGLLWGIDGTALVVATALLAIHHSRRGNDLAAGGFLVFIAGETLILSSVVMDPAVSGPAFCAGAGLWAASLILVSLPPVMPLWIRIVSVVGALLFAVVAVRGFMGQALNPLSQPLPLLAYPFLALTLLGWAWTHYRSAD